MVLIKEFQTNINLYDRIITNRIHITVYTTIVYIPGTHIIFKENEKKFFFFRFGSELKKFKIITGMY